MTQETQSPNISREAFEALLYKGKVSFKFRKKDGTTREALGTLHQSQLPALPSDPAERAAQESKSESFRAANPLTVRFWDLSNGGFRSVNLDTLLMPEPALVQEL